MTTFTSLSLNRRQLPSTLAFSTLSYLSVIDQLGLYVTSHSCKKLVVSHLTVATCLVLDHDHVFEEGDEYKIHDSTLLPAWEVGMNLLVKYSTRVRHFETSLGSGVDNAECVNITLFFMLKFCS